MAPPDVLLLRWPQEDHRRATHAGSGRPTVLIVERGGPMPTVVGPLEDWIYEDASPEEVMRRVELLSSRACVANAAPVLDDGILRHRGRWVAISETQLPVVELLIDNLDQLVPTATARRAYADAGGSTGGSTFRALMHRISRRLATIDITIVSIRGRGFLTLVVPPPAEPDLMAWATKPAEGP
jgi:hypothetical protein